jgi:hypothetical protein
MEEVLQQPKSCEFSLFFISNQNTLSGKSNTARENLHQIIRRAGDFDADKVAGLSSFFQNSLHLPSLLD